MLGVANILFSSACFISIEFRTEALEGHFSYYLQLICYSLIVITYLLMLT